MTEIWEKLNLEAMEYYRKGDLSGAENKFMQAVEEVQKYGADDIRLSECLDNVIWMYHQRGKLKEAEAMIRKSLSIQEKIHGPENQYIAWNLSLLADICYGHGEYEEAEKHYRRSVAIDQKSMDSASPHLLENIRKYTKVLRLLNRDAEALEMEGRAKGTIAR